MDQRLLVRIGIIVLIVVVTDSAATTKLRIPPKRDEVPGSPALFRVKRGHQTDGELSRVKRDPDVLMINSNHPVPENDGLYRVKRVDPVQTVRYKRRAMKPESRLDVDRRRVGPTGNALLSLRRDVFGMEPVTNTGRMRGRHKEKKLSRTYRKRVHVKRKLHPMTSPSRSRRNRLQSSANRRVSRRQRMGGKTKIKKF